MANIKYAYTNNGRNLYKRKVYLPGFITGSGVVGLISTLFAIALQHGIPAYLSLALAIAGSSIFLVGIIPALIVKADSDATWPLYFCWHVGAKKPPSGFDELYLDDPYYQKVLKQHMKGDYVGSLFPLNEELNLKLKDRIPTSGAVENAVAELKAIRESQEIIRELNKERGVS